MNLRNDSDPSAARAGRADLDRRGFLAWIGVGLAGIAGTLVGLPAAGFALASGFRKPHRVWRSVGKLEDFEVGRTVQVTFRAGAAQAWGGPIGNTAAWLRRHGTREFVAFVINCTHLGCPVRWQPGAELFMCPCHGGVYYEDGTVAAGPPPRPLSRYRVRVRRGHVQIETEPLLIV